MAEIKTRPTDASVDDFIDSVADETKRDDSRALVRMMKSITKQEPVMWGPAIIGFGYWVYAYSSGKELTWPLLAFSPRKQSLTIYSIERSKTYKDLLKKVGKAKQSGSCLHFKRLTDVHQPTLKAMMVETYKGMVKRHKGKK